MAMYGKRGVGGSAAVLEAPELGLARDADWPIPEPAPAGTLQRRGAQANAGKQAARKDEDEAYSPRRQSTVYRLRVGLLTTLTGRIVGASLAVLVLGTVITAAIVLRSSLLHDPRFAIATSSEIQIEGNRHLTRAQVLSVFGSDLERNIFKIPLAQRRADVERLPWVAHATVMRLLPNRLRVAITERTPVAFVRQGTHIGLVDAGGVLLDMPEDVAGDRHYSFPVLTGLSEPDPLPVRAARMAVYRSFLADLDSSGEKLTQSLSEVDVSNPEDVKAVVTTGGADVLVHFGDENFLQRYRMFAQNLPQWKTQYPKLAAVDTRYENQFVLEMQPGSAVPLAGDSTAAAGPLAAGDKQPKPALPAKHGADGKIKRIDPKSRLIPQIPKAKPAAGKKPILVHEYAPGNDKQVIR